MIVSLSPQQWKLVHFSDYIISVACLPIFLNVPLNERKHAKHLENEVHPLSRNSFMKPPSWNIFISSSSLTITNKPAGLPFYEGGAFKIVILSVDLQNKRMHFSSLLLFSLEYPTVPCLALLILREFSLRKR